MKRFNDRNRLKFAPLFLAAFAAFGLITMLLWNALLPELFHLPQISFLKAIGLLILSRLLFGFNGPWGRHHDHNRRDPRLFEKWENMNPEELKEFKERWSNRRQAWPDMENRKTNRDASGNNNS
jgi:hypothetical protein